MGITDVALDAPTNAGMPVILENEVVVAAQAEGKVVFAVPLPETMRPDELFESLSA
jgi:hypothetical protein